ncbi:MAG: RagB/SusD family nutrient uptake outer membrane protein [Mangrovibacterium sp.]|nr:RagB/SusD family nutrient uptake outer membrane protein [Mangrovibacterium sp.]
MKNRYNKKIAGVLMVVMLVCLGACEEAGFLDRYPKDSPNPLNFFVNEVSARSAVNACYTPWLFDHSHMYRRDLPILMDALTDDSYPSPNRSDEVALKKWNINPTSGQILNWWRFPYRSINAANFAIENIPLSTDPAFTSDMQAPYIAEAKFFRAYSYWFLTSFYGNIPLLTNPSADFEEFNTPVSPRADVLAQVVEDFTDAKNNLPASQTLQGAPNKSAAAAFLAKMYLVLKDWSKAEAAAREAIQIAEAAGHKLQDDFLSIWSDEWNPEILFAWSFTENVDGWSQNMTVQRLCRNLPATLKLGVYGDGWGTLNPQRALFDAFEQDDPRREYTLFYPGQDFGIYNGTSDFNYTHETYNENGEKVTWNVTYKPGDMVKYDYRWGVTGMNTRKMIQSMKGLVNVYQCGQDVPLMRMAELYLILAEALAEQGKPEALTWVNKVRGRSSVNAPARALNDGRPGGSSLVGIVRHERRVELALEGLRIFDLLRWGTLPEVFGDGKKVKRHFFSDYYPAGSAEKYDTPIGNLTLDPVFPIPQDELDHNSSIDSNNPGW